MIARESRAAPKFVALCGGVGGAKLVLGLERCFGANVTVIVNTGDDFQHLGLHISPDIDTVIYTLAGLSDLERGWGRSDETWSFMESLGGVGGETWFKLGDRDLAMHVERTLSLRSGRSLTAFTTSIARRLGIASTVLPMSDDPVATIIYTDEGPLPFQRYFVEKRCAPVIRRIEFENAGHARPAASVLAALQDPDLGAIIICPSNPYLSVDPILAIPKIRQALRVTNVPVIVVSPLIGGQSIKGPTGKILSELGLSPEPLTLAKHYSEIISGLVIDHKDREAAANLPIPWHSASTLMVSLGDRDKLAAECSEFAIQLSRNAKRHRSTS